MEAQKMLHLRTTIRRKVGFEVSKGKYPGHKN
jgi:hypothetical protein